MTVSVPREIEVTLGKGVSGTLTVPHSADSESPFEQNYAPTTNKAAIILHGQGGHRSYCYQKMLAHKLASDLGIYSLRIDFRGCGNSADNADEKIARIIGQDIEDIQASAEFLLDSKQNPLGMRFMVSSIIGHSRGGVAMFLWALEQDKILKSPDPSKAIVVPNLVNCSARYRSDTVYDRYPHDFEGAYLRSLRYGEIQKVFVSKDEIDSLAAPDMSALRDLSTDFSVLSVYGLEDRIIPVNDGSFYANVLNRGPYSHHLELIPFADHNFYGIEPIETDDDAEDYNPHNLPLNSKKLANHNVMVTSIIIDYLKPENELNRFLYRSFNVGYIPRWKQIDGISNFRDIGAWKIQNPTYRLPNYDNESHYYVKPHIAFRCANTADVTQMGLKELRKLNVKVMFDFRSSIEINNDGSPQNLEKYGIKRIHAPVFSETDYSPEVIAIRYTNLMTSWFTYVNVYEDILENGTSAFRQVFEFIRDEVPASSFVFHCTAGKDRTGVLSMLILLFLGVDKHTISKEYELTTVGLKNDHASIRDKFIKTMENFKTKMENVEDVAQIIAQGRKGWTIEEDGFQNLISSRYEAMLATIELFNQKYGSIVNYMKTQLKFEDSDLLKIYENLVYVSEINKPEPNPMFNLVEFAPKL
ncbi:DEHA2D07678p [Debaryomyces hansenii CBS767]|jgi:protein tyrosine/serine phosphatase|uniref:DEHA2D07678p n=1 Tax=Debaryomyces hansenii (strain ATCC 36239 / CBS 767 / BCRC 21394 / JCM 1990 / NBRC 0083 / IGC 2968) TaxID=284592 RepID=Q6BSM6_DEBHA|nr:DEHA2D07678p [Debaryomyces hansenii CBS767]CAG86938.1 DEHA2D07678p [Debaryomyces hansenii CBS767]|eukprot:XP_458794.1 DEHA2D07678p [Debaryomyces hansenii CBS767]